MNFLQPKFKEMFTAFDPGPGGYYSPPVNTPSRPMGRARSNNPAIDTSKPGWSQIGGMPVPMGGLFGNLIQQLMMQRQQPGMMGQRQGMPPWMGGGNFGPGAFRPTMGNGGMNPPMWSSAPQGQMPQIPQGGIGRPTMMYGSGGMMGGQAPMYRTMQAPMGGLMGNQQNQQ